MGPLKNDKRICGEPLSPRSGVEMTYNYLGFDDFFKRELVTRAYVQGLYLGE